MANSVLNLSLPLESCGIDMRDAFFDQVNTLAASDRNVLMLTDDQGAFSLDWLQQNLPEQYFNVGIAEQNLVSVAAGLALGGKIPYIYGIATFMTMRCYDQIRGDLCCMHLPVTIVGSGAGYTYSGDGPTHHAAQDVAIMRALPGMTIYNPSDATSTASFARMSYQDPGPKYVRLEKGQWGKIYQEGHDFSTGLDVLVGGKDLMIISTGVMTHRALEVAEELATHRVDAGVIDLYRLKPVNPEILLQAIGGASRIVTLEEHSLIGGVGSAVAEIMADKGHLVPIMRLGLADHFSYNYGSREWLQSMEGLDVPRITEEILATL